MKLPNWRGRCLLTLLLVSFRISAPVLAADGESIEGWTPDLILRHKVVGEISVSPGGKRVAFSVAAAVMEDERSEWLSQIHVANADGNNPLQLTRGDKSATAPEWSPDGQSIAFLSPRSGPKANLWRIRPDGGEAEQLTDEKGGIVSFQWSPDGKFIAFLMTDSRTDAEERAERERRDAFVVNENFKRARLYVVSLQAGENSLRTVRRLTSGEMHCGGPLGGRNYDWSPDSKRIVFTHQPTPLVDDWKNADLSLVEVATGKVTPLATTEAAESQPFFSPAGDQVAFVCSEVPSRWAFASRLKVADIDSPRVVTLAETHDLKPSLIGWSADGRRVLAGEAFGTVNRLWAVPTDGSAPIAVSSADAMVSQPVMDATRTRLGFVSEAPDRAAEVHTSSVESFASSQASHVQTVAKLPLGTTQVYRWKSTDGLEIEGLLTLPPRDAAGSRLPLLVVVHGGPTGVFVQNSLLARGPYPLAAFVSRGFAILRCNVRGSSGYGKAFRFANQSDWGGGDYRDIQSGVDALIQQGIADPDRLGIMGWSYGGFMTSWTITQTRRFKAASVGAGVTNLISFTGTSDIADFIPDYMGGEFWTILERWREHSPIAQVAGVTTPTLIQHGDKDLRVPISQGFELYNALKRQKVPTKMVVYPRQPHSIQEPKLLLDAMERNLEWFEEWVR